MKENEKFFNEWNEIKKGIDSQGKCPHFAVGEIRWVSLGKNISSETAGKGNDFLRPILVLKKVYGNAFLGIPLTTKERQGNYYFRFKDLQGINQFALLAQIRYLDAKRLKYKKSKIGQNDFDSLLKSFIELIKK